MLLERSQRLVAGIFELIGSVNANDGFGISPELNAKFLLNDGIARAKRRGTGCGVILIWTREKSVADPGKNGDGDKDVSFRFEFTTEVLNPETFLYNTGQITGLNDAHFNRRQFYTVSRVHGDDVQVLGSHLASPPVNIGPRSTPN